MAPLAVPALAAGWAVPGTVLCGQRSGQGVPRSG